MTERHNILTWFINPATTQLLSPFTTRTPDSLASSVACWSTRNDSLRSGSRSLVSTCLFYTDPDTTTPHSHWVSNKPRFIPLLWWRGAVTSSTNKPIRLRGHLDMPSSNTFLTPGICAASKHQPAGISIILKYRIRNAVRGSRVPPHLFTHVTAETLSPSTTTRAPTIFEWSDSCITLSHTPLSPL